MSKEKEDNMYDAGGLYKPRENEFLQIVCPHYFSISGIITGCDFGPPDCVNCTNPDRKIVKSTITYAST